MYIYSLYKKLFVAVSLAFFIAYFPGTSQAAPETGFGPSATLVPIHEIQGSGLQTPFLGKPVSTSGIVTGLTKSGFFIQSPEKDYDKDEKTSEGIYIQAAPASFPQVKIGLTVQVDGLAQEDKSSYGFLTLTQISGVTGVKALSGNPVPLPKPILLSPADARPKGQADQLEKYEGMRVRMEKASVVGPTIGKKNEAMGTSQSYGIFFVTFPGVPRPFREAGLEPGLFNSYLGSLDGVGKPAKFDGNPEVLKIDTSSQIGCTPLDLSTGASVSNISGILSTNYGAFGIVVDPGTKILSKGTLNAVPVPDKAKNEFSIASYNMERFYDRTDDPQVKYDVAIAPEGVEKRLSKIALTVSKILKYPEIISVQEVENISMLNEIAESLNKQARASGVSDPQYKGFLVEGNCPSGLDIGFLVKTSRVKVIEATQVGADLKIQDPATKQDLPVNLRPPLILRVSIADPAGKPAFDLSIINNHFKSYVKLNDPNYGPFIIKQRQVQAEYLAKLVESIQAKNPREKILLVGDFNAPTETDGLLDVMGIVRGEPKNTGVLFPGQDLVKRSLFDISVMVAKEIRYSYVFNGSAQVLDHVLANRPLAPFISRMCFARCNSDFADSFRNDSKRPERSSDHDIPVVYFQFEPFSLKLADLKKRLEGIKFSRSKTSKSDRRLEADLRNICLEYVDHYVQSGKAMEIRQEFVSPTEPVDSELLNYFEQKAKFRAIQKDE